MKKDFKLFVAMILIVSVFMVGCNEQTAKEETAGTPAATENPLSVERQLKLLSEKSAVWRLEKYEKEEPYIYSGTERYHYRVSDLDQNGRLELMSTTTTGNGYHFYNEYYEVNETGDNLNKLILLEDADGESPAPDIGNVIGEVVENSVYYNAEDGTYHYLEMDYSHGSAVDYDLLYQDFVLSNGKIRVTTYGMDVGSSKGNTHFIVDGKEEKQVSQKELKKWEKQYFEGMEKKTISTLWFNIVDDNSYEKIKASYEAFEISLGN